MQKCMTGLHYVNHSHNSSHNKTDLWDHAGGLGSLWWKRFVKSQAHNKRVKQSDKRSGSTAYCL